MVHLEAQLEAIRCRRAALETRRAGHDALNACRASSDLSPAYGEEAYDVIEDALSKLAQEADDLGVRALMLK